MKYHFGIKLQRSTKYILYLYSLRRILDLRKKTYNVYHKEAVEFTLFIYTQKTYSTYIFQYVLFYGWYSSNKIICATELRFLCVLCKLNSGFIQQLTLINSSFRLRISKINVIYKENTAIYHFFLNMLY